MQNMPETANNGDAEMADAANNWGEIRESLVSAGESNLNVDHAQCQIPGLSRATPEQIDVLRQAIGLVNWFPDIAVAMSAQSRVAQTRPAKDARIVLLRTDIPEDKQPFMLVDSKTTHDNLRTTLGTSEVGNGKICTEQWTERPGVIRNILSPASMTALTFLGQALAEPVIDFAYAFAIGKSEWGKAWLNCPVETDKINFAGSPDRIEKLCSLADIRSPGDAIIRLSSQIVHNLGPAMEAIYNAFESRAFCVGAIRRRVAPVDLSELVKSEAVQCRDCSNNAIAQVQPILPTESALRDPEPVFEDDPSTSWFKIAEYAFKSVRMPVTAITRGDPLSELLWHKYQSDVLYARANCRKLSERQIIQHIMSMGSKDDMHFQTARAASMQPKMTVKRFLETIREYYFTGGQFRLNIEDAWRRFDAENAENFNELIHYIKTHYQLIFIDYAHMAGKQSKLEFAILTFQKILAINKASTTSSLSQALQDFLPRDKLIERFEKNLKPAMQECTDNANSIADEFIEWVTTTLVSVRESANTIKRCMDPIAQDNVDYARLKRKPRPRRDHMLSAAVSDKSDHMQKPGYNRSQPGPAGPSAPPGKVKPQHINGLMGALNSNDPARIIALAHQVKGLADTPDSLKTAFELELNGGVGSLAELYSHASSLPPEIRADKASMLHTMLQSHYCRKNKTCDGCRGTPEEHPDHPVVDCEFVKRHIPPEKVQAFVQAHQFNRTRRFTPLPPGWTPPRVKRDNKNGKRGRYDFNNGGQNKRQHRFENKQHKNPYLC